MATEISVLYLSKFVDEILRSHESLPIYWVNWCLQLTLRLPWAASLHTNADEFLTLLVGACAIWRTQHINEPSRKIAVNTQFLACQITFISNHIFCSSLSEWHVTHDNIADKILHIYKHKYKSTTFSPKVSVLIKRRRQIKRAKR